MKIALVGVGGMGNVHFTIYKGMKNIELVALCDIRMDMLKEKVGDYPVRLYADMDEMLAAEKPDIVDICTPTYLHVEQTIKAMEAGAHVLCEKPMGLNTAETEVLLEAIKRTGKRYMTAQVVRFMNPYVYLKGVIDSGKYGRLESLSMRRFSHAPLWSWENWFLYEKKSGHVALDLMIHDVDFMQSVFGEPRDIVGVYHPLTDTNTNFAFANYIYDGFVVAIETGWYNDQKVTFTADFKAIFENGNLLLKNGQLLENNELVNFADTEKIGETGINISNVDGYAGEIAYFINCVNNDETCEMITPESSANTIRLIDRTLKSLTVI